jgi:hypothetical protein
LSVSETYAIKPEKLDKPDKDPADKALKKAEVERGLLLPADRYKALINAVKASQDLIELGDKKARFALVIMSVLNAVAVLMAVRGGDGLIPKTGIFAKILIVELAAYAIATVYYLSQAIAALRPRGVKPPPLRELPSVIEPGISMRVLFYADIIARDRLAYRELWDGLRTDNLCTELADQLYALSGINRIKFSALDRLYFGLTVMTVMLAAVIGTVGLSHVVG